MKTRRNSQLIYLSIWTVSIYMQYYCNMIMTTLNSIYSLCLQTSSSCKLFRGAESHRLCIYRCRATYPANLHTSSDILSPDFDAFSIATAAKTLSTTLNVPPILTKTFTTSLWPCLAAYFIFRNSARTNLDRGNEFTHII